MRKVRQLIDLAATNATEATIIEALGSTGPAAVLAYQTATAKAKRAGPLPRPDSGVTAVEFAMHGWRKNASIELAETGASDAEIQSVTGHKSLNMVQLYRRRASRKRLAETAQKRRNKE